MRGKPKRSYRRGSVLPIERWHSADRKAWYDAGSLGALLGTGPSTRHWSKATRDMRERGFGKFLGFLATQNAYERPVREAGVSRQQVQAYLQALEADGYSLAGQHNLLTTMRRVLDVLRPNDDMSWLSALARSIPGAALRASERPLPTSDQVWELGIKLMHGARATAAASPLAPRPIREYRAGLILALLAARSMRRGQFLNLTLGRTLFRDGDNFWIEVPAEETKNHKSYRAVLPSELTPYLDAYLGEWYPACGHNGAVRSLWVLENGKRFCPALLNKIVGRETERAFGVSLSPNDFRRVTTTTAVLIDPELVNIAAAVNGHSDPRVIRRHYDRSKGLGAQRAYASQLSEIRRVLAPDSPQGGGARAGRASGLILRSGAKWAQG